MIITSLVNLILIKLRTYQMSAFEKYSINPIREPLLFRPQKKNKDNVELVVRRFADDLRYSYVLIFGSLFLGIKPNYTLIDSLIALVFAIMYLSKSSNLIS